MASSQLSTLSTDITGPKSSTFMVGSSTEFTISTVGPTQLPSSLLAHSRPSTSTLAPAATEAPMRDTMRSRLALSITGPTCPFCWPATKAAALAHTRSRRSPVSPTRSKTDAAIHRCPAHPAKLATMSRAHISASQSGSATRWFLAPPSASTRLLMARHLFATISATLLLPTNVTALTSGWSTSALTVGTDPLTIWKTPSGSPASLRS
mmetsp:Transcript_1388/g.2728  ORF Transcript_1388/g.2728 Transcript_1388/m.2728 type:complete len:208 (+) Transcript_1388:504-1127(+)